MQSVKGDEKIRRQVQASVAGLALPLFLLPFSPIVKTLAALVIGFLLTGNRPYWIYITVKTAPRDLKIIMAMVQVIFKLWKWEFRGMTVPKLFLDLVKQHPDKVAFYSDDGEWTYSKLSSFAARFAASIPIGVCVRGSPVALILGSNPGPRLLGAWIGLAQRGVPSALLPPAARLAALKHAIQAAKATVLIYSDDMVEAIAEIQNDPEMKDIVLLQYNKDKTNNIPILKGATVINPHDESLSDEPDMEEVKKGKYGDSLIYIYTSGTTGLPKAAIITNSRFIMIATVAKQIIGLRPKDDVMYTPLPLHHTAGGVMAAGQALIGGITVALRSKFSASSFWSDCIKYNCTVAQYIGEMCRFLLVANDKTGTPVPEHKLRIMMGNGLRSAIWQRFKTTFRIPVIYEFYGATEGNTNMINTTAVEGAVGFIPRFASFMSPILLVKCDTSTGEPIRDARGFCVPCEPCKPGLLLGKINNQHLSQRLYAYTGYVDKKANDKKMVYDVLQKGDCFFNSGDLFIMDDLGFFYFKDRTGDTFRWRGENVSTAEVEGILTSLVGLTDIVVYGVEIPNVEGRAGMAAIADPQNKMDITTLAQSLTKSLPPFARPLFVRVLPNLPFTTTFKIIKTDLKKDGFDINVIKDSVFFLDSNTSSYVPLTKEVYDDICQGRIRF